MYATSIMSHYYYYYYYCCCCYCIHVDSMGLIPRMNQDLFDKVAEKLVSMNNPSLSDHLGDGTGSTELAPQGSTASRSRHTKKLMQGIEVGTQRASSMDASDHNGDHKDGLEDHKAETKIMITVSD
jgi:hypothetical protein